MSPSNATAQRGQGEYRGGEPGVAIITGVTFAAREVTYSRVEGLAIFEGDIVLGVADELERALAEHRARIRARDDPGERPFRGRDPRRAPPLAGQDDPVPDRLGPTGSRAGPGRDRA